jgi:hypothetical protein
MQRPIERGNRGLELLVEHDPHQRVADVDAHRRAAAGYIRVIPVQPEAVHPAPREFDEPVVRVAQPCGVVVQRHVQRMPAEHPPTSRDHRGNAGQPAADPHGPHPGVGLRQGRVPPLPGTHDVAASHRPGEVEVAGTEPYQLLLLGHAAEPVDEGRDIRHPGMVVAAAALQCTLHEPVRARLPPTPVEDQRHPPARLGSCPLSEIQERRSRRRYGCARSRGRQEARRPQFLSFRADSLPTGGASRRIRGPCRKLRT